MNVCLVIVAFNRPESLKRCLDSLLSAYYPYNVEIDLCISIDQCLSESDREKNRLCFSYANDFEWSFGAKNVIFQKENLGLRKHILTSGDIVLSYDAIVMLEDDIVVSKGFFQYVTQCLDKYSLDPRIASFSLYNHRINFNTGELFSPISDGFDNYFLQICSSWGQVWTRDQWKKFKNWYASNNIDKNLSLSDIPNNVFGWPKSSWLKFFITYMREYDLYSVYPRVSLSTNFSDMGTHNKSTNTEYQVDLLYGSVDNYKLSSLEESYAIYDVFFESLFIRGFIAEMLNCQDGDVSIDFYNTKRNLSRFILTAKKLNFSILKSYSLEYKSYEINVLNSNVGCDLFLYDTLVYKKNKIIRKNLRQNYLGYSGELFYIVKKYLKAVIRS